MPRSNGRNFKFGHYQPPRYARKKGPDPKNGAFPKIIPAATYVPTQLPVQYHRPGEA